MTKEQNQWAEAVFIGCQIFEGKHDKYHADTIINSSDNEDEFGIKIEVTGPGLHSVIELSRESNTPEIILDVLEHAIEGSCVPEWHLSPSQVKELESKIEAYVKASNAHGMATDADEVFEETVLGNLDTLIGDINAK